MSTNRVSSKAGWVSPLRLPKGPNGRNLCRQCGTEVSGRRITFCSDECVDEWKIKTDPGHCRALVERRDNGVCAICRVDTEALMALVRRGDARWSGDDRWVNFLGRFKARHGLGHRCYGWAWDTDHTTPVVEGGGECGLDGYRTLCVWCHRRETKKLRARMKAGKAP